MWETLERGKIIIWSNSSFRHCTNTLRNFEINHIVPVSDPISLFTRVLSMPTFTLVSKTQIKCYGFIEMKIWKIYFKALLILSCLFIFSLLMLFWYIKKKNVTNRTKYSISRFYAEFCVIWRNVYLIVSAGLFIEIFFFFSSRLSKNNENKFSLFFSWRGNHVGTQE